MNSSFNSERSEKIDMVGQKWFGVVMDNKLLLFKDRDSAQIFLINDQKETGIRPNHTYVIFRSSKSGLMEENHEKCYLSF
jgi:hypothetical protein